MFINFIEIGHNHLLKHPLCESFLHLKWLKVNKTGLQPVSRPVKGILGFFQKGFEKESFSNSLKTVQKGVKKTQPPERSKGEITYALHFFRGKF